MDKELKAVLKDVADILDLLFKVSTNHVTQEHGVGLSPLLRSNQGRVAALQMKLSNLASESVPDPVPKPSPKVKDESK